MTAQIELKMVLLYLYTIILPVFKQTLNEHLKMTDENKKNLDFDIDIINQSRSIENVDKIWKKKLSIRNGIIPFCMILHNTHTLSESIGAK